MEKSQDYRNDPAQPEAWQRFSPGRDRCEISSLFFEKGLTCLNKNDRINLFKQERDPREGKSRAGKEKPPAAAMEGGMSRRHKTDAAFQTGA